MINIPVMIKVQQHGFADVPGLATITVCDMSLSRDKRLPLFEFQCDATELRKALSNYNINVSHVHLQGKLQSRN